ncbi:MAG: hypothetical protein WBF42_01105 [Terracidiphilus sp.]
MKHARFVHRSPMVYEEAAATIPRWLRQLVLNFPLLSHFHSARCIA